MRIQLAKDTRQSPVGKTFQRTGVSVFENFPEGIVISECDRIRILTLRVRCKQPRVSLRQIWSQTEKLSFLEIWDVPWRISMVTTRRGTFMSSSFQFPESDTRAPLLTHIDRHTKRLDICLSHFEYLEMDTCDRNLHVESLQMEACDL